MTSSECSESEGEQLLQQGESEEEAESNGLQSVKLEEEAEYTSYLSKLLKWKWREAAILACQLVAYMGCNMAYSLMSPFFPEVVSMHSAHAGLIALCIQHS